MEINAVVPELVWVWHMFQDCYGFTINFHQGWSRSRISMDSRSVTEPVWFIVGSKARWVRDQFQGGYGFRTSFSISYQLITYLLIRRYNRFAVLACLKSVRNRSRSRAFVCQSVIPALMADASTPSCHLNLGLPRLFFMGWVVRFHAYNMASPPEPGALDTL